MRPCGIVGHKSYSLADGDKLIRADGVGLGAYTQCTDNDRSHLGLRMPFLPSKQATCPSLKFPNKYHNNVIKVQIVSSHPASHLSTNTGAQINFDNSPRSWLYRQQVRRASPQPRCLVFRRRTYHKPRLVRNHSNIVQIPFPQHEIHLPNGTTSTSRCVQAQFDSPVVRHLVPNRAGTKAALADTRTAGNERVPAWYLERRD